MLLQDVTLFHYRNYDQKKFEFPQKTTLVIGNNGQGKTNLLEAIAFFSTGQSIRGATIDDCVQLNREYGQISVSVLNNKEESHLEILLSHGTIQGRKTSKVVYSINNVRKQKRAVIGLLPTVAFLPEDLRIITGSPARRRQFLDEILIQIDAEYSNHLDRYTQTLKRRNKVLEQIRDNNLSHNSLTFWTQGILKHGQAIQEARLNLVEQLNQTEFPIQFFFHYDPSVMSEERLEKYAQAEIAVGHTLVGPQKDDFEIKLEIRGQRSEVEINNQSPISNLQSLASHGSRGQQRLGVLWAKLGAFQILEKKNGYPPLLLLDDIFSELDQQHRQMVLQLIEKTQTIITSAEELEMLQFPELSNATIMRL